MSREKNSGEVSVNAVLGSWWAAMGGRLSSAGHKRGQGEPEGLDYDQLVYIHLERGFFAGENRPWRDVAAHYVEHGNRMDGYPAWRMTPARLFALGAGGLLQAAPSMRGPLLADILVGRLGAWLESNPPPRRLPPFLEEDRRYRRSCKRCRGRGWLGPDDSPRLCRDCGGNGERRVA